MPNQVGGLLLLDIKLSFKNVTMFLTIDKHANLKKKIYKITLLTKTSYWTQLKLV